MPQTFAQINWFDVESNYHKCGFGGRAEFWHVGVTKRMQAVRYPSMCPITDHVPIITFCHAPVWPCPFISLLLRLEGPIGVLFTPSHPPIPSTQKRSFPSERSTLRNTLLVNKVGYNYTLGDMIAKTDKCD